MEWKRDYHNTITDGQNMLTISENKRMGTLYAYNVALLLITTIIPQQPLTHNIMPSIVFT